MPEPIRVGIVGYGFMGQTHARAYRWANRHGNVPIETVMIADSRGSAALSSTRGNIDTATSEPDGVNDRPDSSTSPSAVRVVHEAAELLASDDVELVSICTPTPLHVDLAIAALAAGKHVLVEKPVATSPADVQRLIHAADKARAANGLHSVPAMCMRHWPEWNWLANAIKAREHGAPDRGRVRSASFTRFGPRPDWAGFYQDQSLSGGAILDLHIHDVDFIMHCFGVPSAVTSRGDSDSVTTLYDFDTGPARVEAAGGWLATRGYPFTMRFVVEFEHGVADFDIGRDPTLLWHPGHEKSEATQPMMIRVPDGSGYDHQAVDIAEIIRGTREPRVTLRDALHGVMIVDAERRSAQTRQTTNLDLSTATDGPWN